MLEPLPHWSPDPGFTGQMRVSQQTELSLLKQKKISWISVLDPEMKRTHNDICNLKVARQRRQESKKQEVQLTQRVLTDMWNKHFETLNISISGLQTLDHVFQPRTDKPEQQEAVQQTQPLSL